MTGVRVDPATRRARVPAGSLWIDVVQDAAPHGLAALHGSSPDVGVVGYSLGGGIGWYARSLGLQTNSVSAVELVTADGSLVRADHDHEPDLFWALRGGGGNFGVVTALEFDLYPIQTAYAGMLAWDWKHAERVLARWAPWAAEAPDAVLGDDDEAERILAPLRQLAPELDTFARVPAPSLVRLHMDPEGPTPVVSRSALLGDLPDAAFDALLGTAGPDSGSSLLVAAEPPYKSTATWRTNGEDRGTAVRPPPSGNRRVPRSVTHACTASRCPQLHRPADSVQFGRQGPAADLGR
jgi:FAD/FMN-containing dehydrogenase